jgi:hypothetical protein
MNNVLPAIVGIAATYLLLMIIRLGRKKPGYSHVLHTISELGEVGAVNQHLVGYGVFLPVGVALLIVGWLIESQSASAMLLALAIGIGYVVAAFFPCDVGSPVFGSLRQTIHNIAGGIEYGGGGIALMKLGEDYGQPFLAGGFTVLAVLACLTLLPPSAPRGAIQRVGEFTLFSLLLYASWFVWRHV